MATSTTQESRYSATVSALQGQFGKAAVTPGEALSAIPGPQAAKPDSAAYQRIHGGTFPFPVSHIGRRPVVLIADIAATLCGVSHATAANDSTEVLESQSTRRKSGRPRKTAQAAAERSAAFNVAPEVA